MNGLAPNLTNNQSLKFVNISEFIAISENCPLFAIERQLTFINVVLLVYGDIFMPFMFLDT